MAIEEDLADRFASALAESKRQSHELERVWKIVCKQSFLRKDTPARQRYADAFKAYLANPGKPGRQELIAAGPSARGREYRALEALETKRFEGTLARLQKKLSLWHWQDTAGTRWTLHLSFQHSSLQLTAETVQPPKTQNTSAEQATAAFYHALAGRDFISAWEGLSGAYKARRWPNGLGQFIDGYHYLLAVQEILIVPRTILARKAVIDAFFEEKKEVPVIPALNDWQNVTIETAAQSLPHLLSGLYNFLHEFGLQGEALNMMKFRALFHTDAPDAVRWELGILGPELAARYPLTEQHNYRVARRVYLDFENDKWLIRRINWLST